MDSPFKLTWRRGLFATVLAGGAFLLPQEVPLEWYPLNEPGPDILYLEISCASDKNGDFQIYYNTTDGINELDKISVPISPTTQTFTYTFPLKDAPITELRLDPVGDGGALTVRQLRIIDRRGTEIQRFTREDIVPLHQIAGVMALADGWKITSAPGSNDPFARIQLNTPIIAKGINHRNFLRCLYSWSYLALMLWILLLAVLFTFYRPTGFTRREQRTPSHEAESISEPGDLGGKSSARKSGWTDLLLHVGFMASIALLFAFVGNRGLIKNSVHYARFAPPVVSPGAQLEVDLATDHPLVAQLFWDLGRGFNEADSARRDYEPHPGLQTLHFPLPPGPLQALRFDPLDGEARLVLRGLRVVDPAGRTLAVLPPASLEAAQDIARHTATEEVLTVDTAPGRKDPILTFSPAAVSAVNQALAGRTKP
jgi:hypothetical protein